MGTNFDNTNYVSMYKSLRFLITTCHYFTDINLFFYIEDCTEFMGNNKKYFQMTIVR